MRHRLNERKVGSKVREYAKKIQQVGIVSSVRGEGWLVYDEASDVYQAVTFGALSPDGMFRIVFCVLKFHLPSVMRTYFLVSNPCNFVFDEINQFTTTIKTHPHLDPRAKDQVRRVLCGCSRDSEEQVCAGFSQKWLARCSDSICKNAR